MDKNLIIKRTAADLFNNNFFWILYLKISFINKKNKLGPNEFLFDKFKCIKLANQKFHHFQL